ncbi:MAG TPA: caspase family protein, partial [Thermotogota bacterium]|nr:caspase family protein [Thermotogota bacterium]HRW94192.1 caspase family protein [Thermotogota bacterium]
MKEKLLLVGMVLLVGLVVGTDYAIVVGIDNYRWLGTLKYAEKDAEEIGAQLRKMGFNTKILTGKVSGEEILGEIQYMSQYTRSTDTLLFYFSGHGAPGDTERTRGLCTYYSDPKTGNFILTQEQLKRELANFGGKKVVVLDACYQGSDVRNLARDNAAMDRKLGEEVDLLVTSSAANQEANDGFYVGNQFIQNGVVGYYLQRALAGEADSDQNGMLTAGELSGYFLGYAGYMAEQNEQDLQVGYKNRNQPLLVVGESSGSSRVPEGMVLVEKGSFDMGNTRGDSEGDDDE